MQVIYTFFHLICAFFERVKEWLKTSVPWKFWGSLMSKEKEFRRISVYEEQKIARWVQSIVTPDYLENEHWKNGLLLSAVMESIEKDACPSLNMLKLCGRLENTKLALKLMQKYTEIHPAFSAEELCTNDDDAQAKTYVVLAQLMKFAETCLANQDTSNSIRRRRASTAPSKHRPIPLDNRCMAKGMGLNLAVKGRCSRFNIFFECLDHLNVVLEVQGPKNTYCWQKIVKSMPGKNCGDIHSGADQSSRRKIPLQYEVYPKKICVSYSPLEDGKHKLSILWHGHHIAGSPFKIYVDKSSEDESCEQKDGKAEMIRRNSKVCYDKSMISAANNVVGLQKGTVVRRQVLRYILTVGGTDVVVENPDDLCTVVRGLRERDRSKEDDQEENIESIIEYLNQDHNFEETDEERRSEEEVMPSTIFINDDNTFETTDNQLQESKDPDMQNIFHMHELDKFTEKEENKNTQNGKGKKSWFPLSNTEFLANIEEKTETVPSAELLLDEGNRVGSQDKQSVSPILSARIEDDCLCVDESPIKCDLMADKTLHEPGFNLDKKSSNDNGESDFANTFSQVNSFSVSSDEMETKGLPLLSDDAIQTSQVKLVHDDTSNSEQENVVLTAGDTSTKDFLCSDHSTSSSDVEEKMTASCSSKPCNECFQCVVEDYDLQIQKSPCEDLQHLDLASLKLESFDPFSRKVLHRNFEQLFPQGRRLSEGDVNFSLLHAFHTTRNMGIRRRSWSGVDLLPSITESSMELTLLEMSSRSPAEDCGEPESAQDPEDCEVTAEDDKSEGMTIKERMQLLRTASANRERSKSLEAVPNDPAAAINVQRKKDFWERIATNS